MRASLNLSVPTRVTAMQGTVASFDQSTRAGSLLTDDGMPLEFPAASLAEHIRHLRVGQRVFVETDADGAVTSIKIWT
jgi:2-phospho-L-lactate guanylyltransferase